MKKIYVLDDDPIELTRSKAVLEGKGYAVECYEDPFEALRAYRLAPPDILIADVMMPGLDGFELAWMIKNETQFRDAPVVLRSVLLDHEKGKALADAIGVSEYVSKHAHVDELFAAIHNVKVSTVADRSSLSEAEIMSLHAELMTHVYARDPQIRETPGRRNSDYFFRRLNSIATAVPETIIEVDRDGTVMYVNRVDPIWYLGKSETAIGRPLHEVVGRDIHNAMQSWLKRAFEGEELEHRLECLAPDGERVTQWNRYIPGFRDNEVVQTVYVLASDVSETADVESEYHKTKSRYETLLQVNKEIAKAGSEDELLKSVCRAICCGNKFPLAWIGQVDVTSSDAIIPQFFSGASSAYLNGIKLSRREGDPAGGCGAGRAIREKQSVVINDLFSDEGFAPWRDNAKLYGLRSVVAVPILDSDETVIALLAVYGNEEFSPEQVDLFEKIGGELSVALNAMKLKREQEKIAYSLFKITKFYRTIIELKKQMMRAKDETSLMQGVCQLLTQTGGYYIAAVALSEHGSEGLECAVVSGGPTTRKMCAWDASSSASNVVLAAFQTGETVIIRDIDTDDRFFKHKALSGEYGFASMISLPLVMGGNIIGVLTICACDSNAFCEEEIELMAEMANELASGIVTLRQRHQYQLAKGELASQRDLFEAVFRHIPDSMIITDREQKVVLCNAAVMRDFGYAPAEMQGMNPSQLFLSGSEYEKNFDRLFTSGGGDVYTPFTAQFLRKDGESFAGESIMVSYRSGKQGTLGYIIVVRDVTERIGMEEAQSTLQMQLQQAQKMEVVGQLTGGIAHDFNNILASILGYTELAMTRCNSCGDATDNCNTESNSKMIGYLKEVHNGGIRARDIVGQLLAFSRTGGSNKEEVLPAAIVEEAVRLLQPILPSTIGLNTNTQSATPPVFADAAQFQQVMLNLCVNARDAMGGKGQIDISVHHEDSSATTCNACGETLQGDYIVISITDTGSGIPEHIRTRMFDPFFTTKEVGKGTGMGLSMVHGIVHDHMGHIHVDTSPQGTTFKLFLPPVRQKHSTRSAALREGPLHILLVDDQPEMVELLSGMLELRGYRVSAYGDVYSALKEIDDLAIDIVISDYLMPGLNGLQLGEAVRSTRPDIPMILYSSNSESVSEEAAKAAGFSTLLSKPIRASQLLTVISQHCDE